MLKSQVGSFVLTLLFGPLGLFYSSAWLAVIFTLAVLFLVGSGAGSGLAVMVWVLSILCGASAVSSYNKKIMSDFHAEERRYQDLQTDERRHQELLKAAREGRLQ